MTSWKMARPFYFCLFVFSALLAHGCANNVDASAAVGQSSGSVKSCHSNAKDEMDNLQCEFLAMKFDVQVNVQTIKLGDKTEEIKRYSFSDPADVNTRLTQLAKKYDETLTVRAILPGTIVTMDYREDRINFYFDENGKPEKVRRG